MIQIQASIHCTELTAYSFLLALQLFIAMIAMKPTEKVATPHFSLVSAHHISLEFGNFPQSYSFGARRFLCLKAPYCILSASSAMIDR